MGEHFNRIKPANGGQKYLDLADNNEDIPLSRHYKEEFEKAYEKYLHESL